MKYITTYKQIKKSNPKKLRELIRSITLDGLSLITKLPYSKKFFEKPRVQFLYIHYVFDDEIENFDKLLYTLSQNHTFIGYSDAVNKILSDEIDKPYICISSDDGFKNNLKAAEIMEKYGFKGCFFINPDTIGMKEFNEIKTFCNEKLKGPPIEFMDWKDIDILLKKGHEIGSHSMGHINISKTNICEVEENIKQSYEIIKERCGKALHFSYPYGRYFHFNQEAFKLVYESGFISCASAERGCHVSPNMKLKPNELFIRRDNLVCDWNINHVLYFLMNNSVKSSSIKNFSPYQ